MSVYNDMANDAGYAYGTEENQCLAQLIENHEMEQHHQWCMEEEELERYREILFRKFSL
jgi:hypothetical protein